MVRVKDSERETLFVVATHSHLINAVSNLAFPQNAMALRMKTQKRLLTIRKKGEKNIYIAIQGGKITLFRETARKTKTRSYL